MVGRGFTFFNGFFQGTAREWTTFDNIGPLARYIRMEGPAWQSPLTGDPLVSGHSAGYIYAQAVPEPSVFLLLAGGFLGPLTAAKKISVKTESS